MEYKVNEGDGAFYGPKIDFHLQDSLDRTWQCGTVQLDFLMPENLDITYIGEDGEKHRPVMIHRVIYGSIERFIGILTEHFAGAFPVWLAPVQARVLPISERHHEYGQKVFDKLIEAGIRAELDSRSEKVAIRSGKASCRKYPTCLLLEIKKLNREQWQYATASRVTWVQCPWLILLPRLPQRLRRKLTIKGNLGKALCVI